VTRGAKRAQERLEQVERECEEASDEDSTAPATLAFRPNAQTLERALYVLSSTADKAVSAFPLDTANEMDEEEYARQHDGLEKARAGLQRAIEGADAAIATATKTGAPHDWPPNVIHLCQRAAQSGTTAKETWRRTSIALAEITAAIRGFDQSAVHALSQPRQIEQDATWLLGEREANEAALRVMRALMPQKISSLSLHQVRSSVGKKSLNRNYATLT